jgi:serine phosphatase RsbU (regulator of sigma subunit)
VSGLLGPLLEASHELAPADVPRFLERALRDCGLDEAVIYLVDHEQRMLVPLPPHEQRQALDIDSAPAGRAYQTETPVETEADGGHHVWLPMRDGVDRVGILAVQVAETDDALLTACRHIATLAAELLISKGQFTDRFQASQRSRTMLLGAELRWDALPPISFSTDRVSVAAGLEPAYEVMGDAFDYALNEDVLHVAIFDGMGHDLDAARLTNLALGSYRHCRRRGVPLPETYVEMDQAVATTFGPEHFVTAQLAEVDVALGSVELVNAGHPGPLLQRRGRLVPLRQSPIARPLGIGEGQEPSTIRFGLEPGDRLLFYTDGLTDALAPDGTRFGERRVADTIERTCSDMHAPSEAIRRLMHSFVEHRGAEWRDDATVVMVEWRGPRATVPTP